MKIELLKPKQDLKQTNKKQTNHQKTHKTHDT